MNSSPSPSLNISFFFFFFPLPLYGRGSFSQEHCSTGLAINLVYITFDGVDMAVPHSPQPEQRNQLPFLEEFKHQMQLRRDCFRCSRALVLLCGPQPITYTKTQIGQRTAQDKLDEQVSATSFHAEEGGQSRSQHGQEDGAGKNRSFAEVLLPPLHHPSLRDYEMHSLTSLPTSVSFNSSGP